MALLISNKYSKVYRIIAAVYLPVALFDIYKSHAQQGLVVAALSIGLIGYFLLKEKVKSAAVRYGYLGLGVAVGLLALFGTLQKGPFTFLHKASVTYRGDYWHAGIKLFFKHFWFGVGPDSYGDWYRASRTLAATVRRGPSTVSNAAHNVFLDIAATSGIFALLAYFAVIFLGFRAAYRITKRSNEFNPLFVGTFVAWVGYLIQSAISINNIALAIWGWVLPGFLIAMDRWASEPKEVKEVKAVKKIKSAKQNKSLGPLFNIGNLYFNGWGVRRNIKKALYYFNLVISRKIIFPPEQKVKWKELALFLIGKTYFDGTFVKRNKIKGLNFYQKAAKLGNINAASTLESIYSNKENYNLKKKIFYLKQCANAGLSYAHAELALLAGNDKKLFLKHFKNKPLS